MPITLKEAKRAIWAAISNCPNDKPLIQYACKEEDYDVFLSVLQIPQIKKEIERKGISFELVPTDEELLQFQREFQMMQYALVTAAHQLSARSDLSAVRWLQELYTHSHVSYTNSFERVSKVLSRAFPVEILNYDPLGEKLVAKREAQNLEAELIKLVRPESEKAEVEEVSQLFDKLSNSTTYISIQIDPVPAFILVGIIQLATRHPNMEPEMIKSSKDIALNLIDGISELVPEARKYLEMGWHVEFDKG